MCVQASPAPAFATSALDQSKATEEELLSIIKSRGGPSLESKLKLPPVEVVIAILQHFPGLACTFAHCVGGCFGPQRQSSGTNIAFKLFLPHQNDAYNVIMASRMCQRTVFACSVVTNLNPSNDQITLCAQMCRNTVRLRPCATSLLAFSLLHHEAATGRSP